uniref:RxLR effector candidate protein n=1 Tax=Hyaloperonospora arabidopsidis (strain Emoy2) TaxID=559515 RepID=M4B6Z7_HYAAE
MALKNIHGIWAILPKGHLVLAYVLRLRVPPPLHLVLAMTTASLQYPIHKELGVPLLVKQRRWRPVCRLQPMRLWLTR